MVADRKGGVVLGRSLAAFPAALVKNALPGRSRARDASERSWGPTRRCRRGTGWSSPASPPGWPRRSRGGSAAAPPGPRRGAAAHRGLSAAAWGAVVRPCASWCCAAQAGTAGGRGGDEIEDLRRVRGPEAGDRRARALDNVFLGRYQVLELLGPGGWGACSAAGTRSSSAPWPSRPCAWDRAPAGQAPAPHRHLLREAVTVARFSHPNVVPVYDVEDSPEGAFIAMELVEGVSLERLLWSGAACPYAGRPAGGGHGPRARRGPRARHRPPGRQTRQRPARPRRLHQGLGLRHLRAPGRHQCQREGRLRHARLRAAREPERGESAPPPTSSPSARSSTAA